MFLERITHRSIHKKRSTTNSKETIAGSTPSTLDPAVEVLLCQGDHVTPAWTEPILAYMLREELPDDTAKARRITRRAKAYTVINGELYKRSTSGIFQRCVDLEDGKTILRDIHAGTCGHHAGSRSLVAQAFRAGFYLPTALKDAEDIVRRCIGC